MTSSPHQHLLADLNDAQRAVACAPGGPALVIAGAGSGKTRALTRRVAYLLSLGVSPERVLLLTFTNKAAHELLSRVISLVGSRADALWSGTFHHIGLRILREHAPLIGFPPAFHVLDATDAADLMAECAALLPATTHTPQGRVKKPTPKALLRVLSLALNTCVSVHRALARAAPALLPLTDPILSTLDAYARRKQAMGVMDYDDLLLRWLQLFCEHPHIHRAYADRFEHVLIDEYQDTNALQARLVSLCAATHNNLMAVGDDSQSIYSFRGADFTQILRFPSEHAPCNLLLLQHNYRSTPPILALADACIRSNIHRFDKVLVPTRCTPSAPKPSLTPTADPDDQAAWIASRVQALLKAGASPSDIAILYRAHNHALPLQLPLAQRAIPFTVRSGTRFFEQPHVKDLTALLRLSINPLDSLSFSRLIRRCDGVGAARASLLWGHLTADAATPDVISARLRHPTFAAAIGPSALPTLTRLLDALSALRSSPHTHPCDLIAIAIQRFCAPLLQDPARAASSPPASSPGAAQPTDAAALLHDLQQVATFAAAHLTLPDLLAAIALHTSADDLTASTSAPKAPPPQVTLSTIHQAKGLEWPIVFIPHLIDGAFPLAASSSSLADIEEERRLLYVAITRARDALFLCYPQSSSALRFTPTHLSRFLRDLPLSLFETP